MPPSSDTIAAIVLASIIAVILIVVLVLVLVLNSNCCRPLAPSGAPADKTVMLRTPGLSNATMTVTVNGTTLSGESTMVAPGTLSYQIVVPAHMEPTGNFKIAYELPGVPQKHMVPAEKVGSGTIDAATNDIWTLINVNEGWWAPPVKSGDSYTFVKSGDSYTFVKQYQVCSHCGDEDYIFDPSLRKCFPSSCSSDVSKCPRDTWRMPITVDGPCPSGSGNGFHTLYVGGVRWA